MERERALDDVFGIRVIAVLLGQFRLRDKGAMRLTLNKTLIRETRPDRNTAWELRVLMFAIVRRFFNV